MRLLYIVSKGTTLPWPRFRCTSRPTAPSRSAKMSPWSALSSFAPRASAQPFQTYTGTRCSLSLLNSSRMGGTPTPSMR